MPVQKDWERVSRGCNTSKHKVMPTDLHTTSIFIFIVYRKPTPSSRFSTPSVSASDTHSSMALFHMMTYPDKMKDSMLTMCVFPRSVPTYSHLLWKGRWQNVILQSKETRRKTGWASAKQRFVPSLGQTHNHTSLSVRIVIYSCCCLCWCAYMCSSCCPCEMGAAQNTSHLKYYKIRNVLKSLLTQRKSRRGCNVR